jgi:hypothetical protein
MCLPVSRLFWVSSLAYPNLLGTKGYVVVVVVVVSFYLLTSEKSNVLYFGQIYTKKYINICGTQLVSLDRLLNLFL